MPEMILLCTIPVFYLLGDFEKNLLKKNGWFILEQSSDDDIIKNEYLVENRKYGHVSFTIYKYLK